MSKTLTPYRMFTAANGVPFTVRYLPTGTRYGLDFTLITDGPTVEFYDTRHADDGTPGQSGFGPMGQFVSRYYASTMLGTDGYGTGTWGLVLDTGSPDWVVDPDTMGEVRKWVAATFLSDPTRLTVGDDGKIRA